MTGVGSVKNKHKKDSVRIALIQMPCGTSLEQNLRAAVAQIKIAAAKGAQIVALQELFNTLYFCQAQRTKSFDGAQTIPGEATKVLSELARSKKIVIIAPLFEKAAKGVYYNSAAVIDADGRWLGTYRKMHIPDDPGFYEKFYFAPGDLGFRCFKTRYAKLGVLICWDQWFPEAARLTALQGADILFYPTAIGWKPNQPAETRSYHSAWETIQRGHAIANGVYVASVNRVGKEGAIKFWGSSFVADPFGEIRARAGSTRAEILIEDCDLNLVDKTRREWPFLRDRRIDAYKKITSRFLGR